MADLLTLDEIRDFLGIHPTNHTKDAMYEALIPAASAAVKSYTERDFGSEVVTEARTFTYDGSGFLDIDDATEITQVEMTNLGAGTPDQALDTGLWMPMPARRDDAPVFTYIVMPVGSPYNGVNPAMGFIRNLDIYYAEHSTPSVPSMVKVTGTWGWPEVPADVKLATLWVVSDWAAAGSVSSDLTSEAIEGWSRSWGGRGGTSMAIPNRSRDILAQYAKTEV